MNNRQIAKNNMYKKLLTFFAVPANIAIWTAFTRLVTEIANFVSLNSDLDDATQTQAQVTTGITVGKSDAFNAMIKMTVEMAFKAYVWAVDNNNDELIEVFNVLLNDFDGIAESEALDKVKNIRDGINTNIAGMAGVNLLPADVTALDALITAYNAVKSAPEVAIGHKETSTDAIVELFHDIDDSLGLISRLIISQYGTTNAGMVSDFKNNKHIDDLPTHHSGIHTHITDALTGEDIEGALLAIPVAGKSSTSNINGIAEIIKIKNGDYHVNVTMAGYKPQTFKTKILRGKITAFDIQLSQTSGGGVTATREGDVPPGSPTNIDIAGINPTPLTQISIKTLGSTIRVYASATAGAAPVPGDPFIDVEPGTNYQKLITAFIATLGFNDTKKFLNIQNMGTFSAHYTFSFDNLEG